MLPIGERRELILEQADTLGYERCGENGNVPPKETSPVYQALKPFVNPATGELQLPQTLPAGGGFNREKLVKMFRSIGKPYIEGAFMTKLTASTICNMPPRPPSSTPTAMASMWPMRRSGRSRCSKATPFPPSRAALCGRGAWQHDTGCRWKFLARLDHARQRESRYGTARRALSGRRGCGWRTVLQPEFCGLPAVHPGRKI